MKKDTYRTIVKPSSEVLFKDKNSKFYGYAFPVSTEDEFKMHLLELKKNHHSARHWCYAFQIGVEDIHYRTNDDGEPNNSAGQPIYGQIQSYDLTNVLVVVVRYFGGVKLGVGGLINAYRSAAQMALENSKIVQRTINVHFLLSFEYQNMNKVMRIIKENRIKIINQVLELNCSIEISVRKANKKKVLDLFQSLYAVELKEL